MTSMASPVDSGTPNCCAAASAFDTVGFEMIRGEACDGKRGVSPVEWRKTNYCLRARSTTRACGLKHRRTARERFKVHDANATSTDYADVEDAILQRHADRWLAGRSRTVQRRGEQQPGGGESTDG